MHAGKCVERGGGRGGLQRLPADLPAALGILARLDVLGGTVVDFSLLCRLCRVVHHLNARLQSGYLKYKSEHVRKLDFSPGWSFRHSLEILAKCTQGKVQEGAAASASFPPAL